MHHVFDRAKLFILNTCCCLPPSAQTSHGEPTHNINVMLTFDLALPLGIGMVRLCVLCPNEFCPKFVAELRANTVTLVYSNTNTVNANAQAMAKIIKG